MDSWLINVCLTLLPVLLLYVLTGRPKPRRPPGPSRLPVLGNILHMPSSRLWEKALEWKKDYGDLVYVENLGKPMLIINSYNIALDFLGNKSAIYSSRPRLVMAAELERLDWLSLLAPYGERLRNLRTFQHRFFNSPETLKFLDSHLNETRRMLKRILDDPEGYASHIGSLPGTLVAMDVYNHRVTDYSKDRFIGLGLSTIKYLAETEQFLFLDFIPQLKHLPEWLPWASFQRVAREAREVSHAMQFEMHEATKKRLAEGTAGSCMTSILLSENTMEDGSVRDEDDIRTAAATLFVGAVHTSVTSIMTFVLGMLKNPEAQKLGQSEIDTVVGFDCLPSFKDKERLPYIHAICEETLRYASVSPLGFPRTTTEDDEYRGYHIPAGATVVANQWAMAYDPKVHKDPFAVRPERWLPKENGGDAQEPLPHNYTFGFGRRACVGQKWAENLLFISVASMLAAFNFEKAVGGDGKPIEPNGEYSPGFARSLGPSKCKITPRSAKIASLIREEESTAEC